MSLCQENIEMLNETKEDQCAAVVVSSHRMHIIQHNPATWTFKQIQSYQYNNSSPYYDLQQAMTQMQKIAVMWRCLQAFDPASELCIEKNAW